MASNSYVNKVIYGSQTLIDLTSDTVTSDSMLAGTSAHNAAGETITGNIVLPSVVGEVLTLMGSVDGTILTI